MLPLSFFGAVRMGIPGRKHGESGQVRKRGCIGCTRMRLERSGRSREEVTSAPRGFVRGFRSIARHRDMGECRWGRGRW